MAQFFRTCIFCGGRGLTKEHIWPRWLHAYIPPELKEHAVRLEVNWPDRAETSIVKRQGDTQSRTVRRVCVNCNGGWMSALQERAKPIIVPLLSACRGVLTRKQQTTLAAWAAMTTMTAEQIDERKMTVSQEDREYLMQHGEAPGHWRIWLADYRCERRKSRYDFRCAPLYLAGEIVPDQPYAGPATPNTQASTFVLGRLLVHTFCSTAIRSQVARWRFRSPVCAPAMQQIWRVRTPRIQWPPTVTLDDRGAEHVAEAFYKQVRHHGTKAALRELAAEVGD